MNPFVALAWMAVGMLGLAAAPSAPSQVPRDAFALRPLDWIPVIPQVRVIPVAFPETKPMGYVHALASTGDRLWISVHPFGDTNLPPNAGRLWSYLPGKDLLEPATGILQGHAVAGLRAQGKHLWLMIDGGLARLDSRTFAVDAFGQPQGMTSANPTAVAETARGFFALGDSGALFRLSPDERGFLQIDTAPAATGDPSGRRFLAGSGDWLLAATGRRLAVRQAEATRWNPQPPALKPRSPELDPVGILAVCSDGEGGFWIGTDAGLGFLQADTGKVEFRERTGGVGVPGGVGIPIAAGMQPTAAAIQAARARVAEGIRDRMRLRARLARASRETGAAIDPVTPTSRIPGGIRALAMDRGFLWVAAADPWVPMRSRILLFHPGSRKWIGGFSFGFPVTALAVDDRYLWVGADTQFARATPLYAVEKSTLLSIPAPRWVPDALEAEEIRTRVASLTAPEKAVFAFFSGDAAGVLRWTEGGSVTDEQAFLRAMAHDALGLDQPDQMALLLRRLVLQHPDSVFTGLATGLLERLPTSAAPRPPESVPALAAEPAPTAVPEQPVGPASPSPGEATQSPATRPPVESSSPTVPAAPPSAPTPSPSPTNLTATPRGQPTPASTASKDSAASRVLQRRDLNRDGRLNLVEWRLWQGPKAELKAWDRNGDGELDPEEFQTYLDSNPAP